MKRERDMNMIRDILLLVESGPLDKPIDIVRDGWTDDVIYFHLELMEEADLIEIGSSWDGHVDLEKSEYVPPRVGRITWEGYEFLDAARSPEVWDQANKQVASTVGTASLSVLTAVLIEVAKQQLGLR